MMNALALLVVLMLQENPTCHALPPEQMNLNGQAFQVDTYECYWRGPDNPPTHKFIAWRPVCPTYIQPPVLLSEPNLHKGWVMNQFGEFYPATDNIDMMEVYRPRC